VKGNWLKRAGVSQFGWLGVSAGRRVPLFLGILSWVLTRAGYRVGMVIDMIEATML
jgi:hypothetical protein